MGADGYSVLSVGNPRGILGHLLRPHPLHLLNITIAILIDGML